MGTSNEEMDPAVANYVESFSDIFQEVPDNEYLLRKVLHQTDRNPGSPVKNEISASESDYDLSDSRFAVSCPYSRPAVFQNCDNVNKKSVHPKLKKMHNFNETRKNLQRSPKVAQKNMDSIANLTKDKYAEAVWHAKNVQPHVELTDIFAAAKNSRDGKFLQTSEIVEKTVGLSELLKEPKISPRHNENGVRKAVFQKCRSTLLSYKVSEDPRRKLFDPQSFNATFQSTEIDPPTLISEISPNCESSSVVSKEASKVKPIRSKLDIMVMLRKYSNPEAQTLPFEKARSSVEDGVNDHDEVCPEETRGESSGMSKCNSSYAHETSLSKTLINHVKNCTISEKITKQNGETNMTNSLVQKSKSNESYSSCCKVVQNSIVSDHLNQQIGSATPDYCIKKPVGVKSEVVTNHSVVSCRMQTRIQTNSLVVKNAKDLLNGKIPLRNKTEVFSMKNDKPKPLFKNVYSVIKKNMSNGYNCVNSDDFKHVISTPANSMQTGSPTKSSPSRQLKRTLSADKNISADSVQNGTGFLPKKNCQINGVDPAASTSDFKLHNGNQWESGCYDSEKSLPNIDFPVIEPKQPQTNLSNVIQCATKPIYISPSNTFLLGNSFVPSSTPQNQSMFPTINPFAMQQQKPFSFPLSSFSVSNSCGTYPIYAQMPNVSLGSQSNIQTNFLYQPSPNVESNVQGNNEINVNSIFNIRPFIQSIQIPTGSRKGPVVMQNSTCSTHTFTNAETVLSSKQLKARGFSLIKNCAEADRKLCVYDISDFALRFFTEEEAFSKLTVIEFYRFSPVAELLKLKVSETVTDFDDDPKIEYVFESTFEEKPLRELVKDYVTFHVEAIYKHPASKDYFVRKAFKYFPFRDCSYLCESLPKDDEDLNLKDIILFLSCSALLVIIDECKKRNIM